MPVFGNTRDWPNRCEHILNQENKNTRMLGQYKFYELVDGTLDQSWCQTLWPLWWEVRTPASQSHLIVLEGSHTAHCPGAPRLHSGRGTRFQWVVKIRTQSMNQWVQCRQQALYPWPGLTPERDALLPQILPIYTCNQPYVSVHPHKYTTLLSFSCSC